MKLLMENWRKWARDGVESDAGSVKVDEGFMDNLRKWTGIAPKPVPATDDPPEPGSAEEIFKDYPNEYSIFVEWLTADLKDPIAIYWRDNWKDIKGSYNGRLHFPGTIPSQEFFKIDKKTWGHINSIKKKFPYDVFEPPDRGCQEKLNLLNGLHKAFIEDPTRTTSEFQEKLNELKFDPEALTPYEQCAIDISNQQKADKEVEAV